MDALRFASLPRTLLAAATTGGAAFCASTLNIAAATNCRIYSTDAACERQCFPPGSACVILTGEVCNAENEIDCIGVSGSSGTGCAAAGAA
jgi:hypothetical protein